MYTLVVIFIIESNEIPLEGSVMAHLVRNYGICIQAELQAVSKYLHKKDVVQGTEQSRRASIAVL